MQPGLSRHNVREPGHLREPLDSVYILSHVARFRNVTRSNVIQLKAWTSATVRASGEKRKREKISRGDDGPP